MDSKKIISDHNKKLFDKLIPNKNEPIICNSILDGNQEITNFSFQEIAKQHLEEILEHQEFLTEFEQMKHNLNLN